MRVDDVLEEDRVQQLWSTPGCDVVIKDWGVADDAPSRTSDPQIFRRRSWSPCMPFARCGGRRESSGEGRHGRK